jgi:hypothetical protein
MTRKLTNRSAAQRPPGLNTADAFADVCLELRSLPPVRPFFPLPPSSTIQKRTFFRASPCPGHSKIQFSNMALRISFKPDFAAAEKRARQESLSPYKSSADRRLLRGRSEYLPHSVCFAYGSPFSIC